MLTYIGMLRIWRLGQPAPYISAAGRSWEVAMAEKTNSDAHGVAGSLRERLARRQIRPRQGADLPHRHAGHRPPAADAARARPARRAEHGRLRLRLSRLAARRARPAALRAPRSCSTAANIVFQPGLNEELAATAVWGTQQAEMRGEGKYDGVFGALVRQGPGRRPHRRRLPPRQHGRHLAAWRRALR